MSGVFHSCDDESIGSTSGVAQVPLLCDLSDAVGAAECSSQNWILEWCTDGMDGIHVHKSTYEWPILSYPVVVGRVEIQSERVYASVDRRYTSCERFHLIVGQNRILYVSCKLGY